MSNIQVASRISYYKEQNPEAGLFQDERVFCYVMLQLFYMNDNSFNDLDPLVTDSANDGGIDFIYFDEEDNKLIVAQCKYTASISKRDIIEELSTMSSTVEKFRKFDTGSFNIKLKSALQNEIDRFDSSNEDIEYVLFTTATLDKDAINREIESVERPFSLDSVMLFDINDILEAIDRQAEETQRISEEFNLNIDAASNILKYTGPDSVGASGILVNVSSKSIHQMYNRYITRGLLDMNIRKFVKNINVDTGIKHTLAQERDIFWFLNNGIIIACENFYPDGNTVKIYNFSIVNGGQTTTLIGQDASSDQREFFVPCKIISYSNRDEDEFFLKIARATNSQKPIQLRDLNSNSPEMKRLANWLARDGRIYLDIKRGEKNTSNRLTKTIRNDELGQLILSMVYQQPGSARSSKKAIFENKDFYNRIFKKRYDQDVDKKTFIMDLIDLNQRYVAISKKLRHRDNNTINHEEQIVLGNGKYCIFAILGILFHLVKDDQFINTPNIRTECSTVRDKKFPYGMLIGNYRGDDIDELLQQLIIMINSVLSEIYNSQLQSKEITSASNLFKTDKKYYDVILKTFFSRLNYPTGRDIVKIAEELFV